MIYTFLYGIDAIFRINKNFWFHTTAYFLSCIITIIGWNFLRNSKTLAKSCLGFIFIPAFPLFNTLYSFGPYLEKFHINFFLIFGGLYFTVLAGSLVFIAAKTKGNCAKKKGIQMLFIILSGIMIFLHCCIETISIFENFAVGLTIFSILLVAYYYLKVIIIRINKDDKKSRKLNSISNVMFWIYIFLYDFACFGMAAGSV